MLTCSIEDVVMLQTGPNGDEARMSVHFRAGSVALVAATNHT
jgi:hypothetical protein